MMELCGICGHQVNPGFVGCACGAYKIQQTSRKGATMAGAAITLGGILGLTAMSIVPLFIGGFLAFIATKANREIRWVRRS